MFDLALKAHLPIIGVTTDDPTHLEQVLRFYTKLRVQKWDPGVKLLSSYLYWTDKSEKVDVALYQKLESDEIQLIVVNPAETSPLIFNAGALPTPEPMVRDLLAEMVGEEWVGSLLPSVRGLSLRVVKEVLLLTQARVGNGSPAEVRRTRASLSGSTTGLYLEDTSYDFYVWPYELKSWLDLNKDYFHKQVHAKLVPRGLLFEGPPGVGKSMAAKALANAFTVPLYRLDITSTLDKWAGVSESRVDTILALADREAPCVLLIDEIEKVFQQSDETGVIKRLLSKLLWWLAEHQSRVFTVMTTNDKSDVPPEMYRAGRMDAVMKITPLSFPDAVTFGRKVLTSIIPNASEAYKTEVHKALQSVANNTNQVTFVHADVAEVVYTLIKLNKWA